MTESNQRLHAQPPTDPPKALQSATLPLLRSVGDASVALLIIATVFDKYLYRILAEVEPDSVYGFQRFLVVFGTDLVLLVSGILGIARLATWNRQRWRAAPSGLVGTGIFALVATVALVANPFMSSGIFWARLVCAVGVVAIVAEFDRDRYLKFVLWPLVGVVAVEAIVALLQVYVWDSGVDSLWQQAGTRVNTRTAGLGTMWGPYQLSLFLTVGATILLASFEQFKHRWIVAVAVALGTFAVATTYGRTGAVAVILVGGTYLVGAIVKRSRHQAIMSSLVVGPFALGVATNSTPWAEALGKTTGSGSLNRATSGRLELIDASVDMIANRPIFGYGIRQWMTGLAEVRDAPLTTAPVHNVPLLAGAEMGLAALATLLVWYAVLFLRSIRTSVGAIAIFLSAAPALMLDKMTLEDATMMVVAVLWVASLDFHWLEKQSKPEAASTPVTV